MNTIRPDVMKSHRALANGDVGEQGQPMDCVCVFTLCVHVEQSKLSDLILSNGPEALWLSIKHSIKYILRL